MTNIRFMKHKNLWYLLSLIVIIAGMVSFAVQGLNLGIDFTGGNVIEIKFIDKDVNITSLREFMDNKDLKNSIQEVGKNQYILKTEELSEVKSSGLIKELESNFGELDLRRNEKVSAVIGGELTQKALMALGLASILMIIYITFRFEFLFGIAAIIAILHDVLVTVGVFSLIRMEVTTSFIAALLTIIGYSLNDTIVIFDRIRENNSLKSKLSQSEVIDLSVNQCLFRSICTSGVVILVLLCLLFLGGNNIRDFVVAMLIGSVSGVYSTVFVASPLWIDLRKLTKKAKKQ